MEKQKLRETEKASLFVYKALNHSGLDIKTDDLIWILDEEQNQSAIIPLNLQGTSYFKINRDGTFLYDEDNIEGLKMDFDFKEVGTAIRNATSKIKEDSNTQEELRLKAEELMEYISNENIDRLKLKEILEKENLKLNNNLQNKEEMIKAITEHSNQVREKADSIGMEKFEVEEMLKKPEQQIPPSHYLTSICREAKEKLTCVNEMVEIGEKTEKENERKTIFNCAKTVLTSRIKGWREKLNEFGEKTKDFLIKHGGNIFLASLLMAPTQAVYATSVAPESKDFWEEPERNHVVIDYRFGDLENATKASKIDQYRNAISATDKNIENTISYIEQCEKSIEKINEKIEKIDEELKEAKTISAVVNKNKEKNKLSEQEEEERNLLESFKKELLTFENRKQELEKEYEKIYWTIGENDLEEVESLKKQIDVELKNIEAREQWRKEADENIEKLTKEIQELEEQLNVLGISNEAVKTINKTKEEKEEELKKNEVEKYKLERSIEDIKKLIEDYERNIKDTMAARYEGSPTMKEVLAGDVRGDRPITIDVENGKIYEGIQENEINKNETEGLRDKDVTVGDKALEASELLNNAKEHLMEYGEIDHQR